MLPLRAYLAERKSDIQGQIKALRAELAEIDAAERALSSAESSKLAPRERGSSGTGRKTLKEMALEALAEYPEGAIALEILETIKAKFGADIARESLSPQLSRLGQDGVLTRSGMHWRLANPPHPDVGGAQAAPQKNETQGGATTDTSLSGADLNEEDLLG